MFCLSSIKFCYFGKSSCSGEFYNNLQRNVKYKSPINFCNWGLIWWHCTVILWENIDYYHTNCTFNYSTLSFQSFYIQNKTDWERKLINLCKYSVWMIVKHVHRRRSSHFLYEVLHFSLQSPDLETSFNNLVRAHDGLKRFTPPFWQRAAFCFCWLEELQVLHNTWTFFNKQL